MTVAGYQPGITSSVASVALAIDTTLNKDVWNVGLVSLSVIIERANVVVWVSGSSRGNPATTYENVEGLLLIDGVAVEGFYGWNYSNTQATSWGCHWHGNPALGMRVFSVNLVLRSYVAGAASTYIRPATVDYEHLRLTVMQL